MEKYVRTNVNLPEEFINDFFEIAKEEYGRNELKIDFDKVVEWLGVTKGNLKRLMVSLPIYSGIDYITDKSIVKRDTGAVIKELITITPDCFKLLCMMSKSERGQYVRRYFLELEHSIRMFISAEMKRMKKKIEHLEFERKPKTKHKSGSVYFFPVHNEDDEDEIQKIGKTTDILKRLIAYATGRQYDISKIVVFDVDDIDEVERCIKVYLRKFLVRKRHELYKINSIKLMKVFEHCEKSSLDIKNMNLDDTIKKK